MTKCESIFPKFEQVLEHFPQFANRPKKAPKGGGGGCGVLPYIRRGFYLTTPAR